MCIYFIIIQTKVLIGDEPYELGFETNDSMLLTTSDPVEDMFEKAGENYRYEVGDYIKINKDLGRTFRVFRVESNASSSSSSSFPLSNCSLLIADQHGEEIVLIIYLRNNYLRLSRSNV